MLWHTLNVDRTTGRPKHAIGVATLTVATLVAVLTAERTSRPARRRTFGSSMAWQPAADVIRNALVLPVEADRPRPAPKPTPPPLMVLGPKLAPPPAIRPVADPPPADPTPTVPLPVPADPKPTVPMRRAELMELDTVPLHRAPGGRFATRSQKGGR